MIKVSIDGIADVVSYNVNDFPYEKVFEDFTILEGKNKYISLVSAFDIETTSMHEWSSPHVRKMGEAPDVHYGFMYLWQWCIEDTVCMGRTWEEFQQFLYNIGMYIPTGCKLVTYVHNLGFEFQFMRNFIKITSLFAKAVRKPLYVRTPQIEFRCSYFLTNMGLDKFLKTTRNVRFYKQVGKLDYTKIRTPKTRLTNEELSYAYCDVRGLVEAIKTKLEDDTLETIPLTSTGYCRRDFREAVLANPANQKHMQKIALTPQTYALTKGAFRGGNTAVNPLWANRLIEGLEGYDIKSSYPAVMFAELFPMSKFVQARIESEAQLKKLVGKYACLMHIGLLNVAIKDTKIIPYISIAHTYKRKNTHFFNGRLLDADYVELKITDIDYQIIANQYKYDNICVFDMYYAKYDKLPFEFRKELADYFFNKCRLEVQKDVLVGDMQEDAIFLYNKYKNVINASYGMIVTDITNDDIEYDGEWKSEKKKDMGKALADYYANRKSFLSYQHGVWVTAHARKRLQEGLDAIGRDAVYVDTDSIKTFTGHADKFEAINAKWIEKLRKNDIDIIPKIDGKEFILGAWSYEYTCDKFKSVGSKKYCTVIGGELEITVAGVNKKSGSKYLADHGGIEAFVAADLFGAEGFTWDEKHSGRTTAWYDDDNTIKKITVNGDTFTTSSNLSIGNTTYVLGMTDSFVGHIIDVQGGYNLKQGELVSGEAFGR